MKIRDLVRLNSNSGIKKGDRLVVVFDIPGQMGEGYEVRCGYPVMVQSVWRTGDIVIDGGVRYDKVGYCRSKKNWRIPRESEKLLCGHLVRASEKQIEELNRITTEWEKERQLLKDSERAEKEARQAVRDAIQVTREAEARMRYPDLLSRFIEVQPDLWMVTATHPEKGDWTMVVTISPEHGYDKEWNEIPATRMDPVIFCQDHDRLQSRNPSGVVVVGDWRQAVWSYLVYMDL